MGWSWFFLSRKTRKRLRGLDVAGFSAGDAILQEDNFYIQQEDGFNIEIDF